MRTSILTGAALILVVTVILYLLRDPLVRLIITVLEIPGVLVAIGLVVAGIGLFSERSSIRLGFERRLSFSFYRWNIQEARSPLRLQKQI